MSNSATRLDRRVVVVDVVVLVLVVAAVVQGGPKYSTKLMAL